MIKDQFMATDTTVNGFEITKPFPTSSNPELVGDDPAKPYYMGYVKDEDISASFKFSNWTYDEDAGEIRVTQVNENRPWGFVGETSGGYFYGAAIANDGTGNWVNMPNSGNRKPYRFINKGVMARPIFDPNLTISYSYVEKTGTYTWRTGSGTLSGQVSGKKYQDLLEFIAGNQTWTLNSFWGTFDLNYSDFSEYGWAEVTDSANHTIYLWFHSCTFTSGACNIGGNSGLRIVPFFRTSMPNGKYAYLVPDCRSPVGGGSDSAVSINVNASSGWKITSTYYYYGEHYLGLPPTTVRTDLIVNTCNTSTNTGLVHERYFWSGSGSYYGAIVVTFTLKDFANWLGNFNKFAKVGAWQQNTDTYTNDTFVNLYNTDNTPKYEISTLPFSSALDKILQPWQKPAYDISEDEFDVDSDLPGGGGGGDTPSPEPRDLPHDEGDPAGLQDRSLGAPTMFITQYALTYGEISTVGLNLWTSWLTTNTDVWKNFFLPYKQDFGTLNISAAMETIISLRAYPFEIPLDLLLPSPNGVRMGTGHTDFLGGAATVVKTTICKIPLGECEVKPESPYDDFRDMYNASISCFLPYCGTVSLNPAEVIGRTLKCYYLVDFQSGGCTAVITLVGDSGEYILASKSGQIGFTLPMTATNAGQLAAQTMGDAVQTMGTIGGLYFDVAGSIGRSAENLVQWQKSTKKDKGEKPVGMTVSESLNVGESAFNSLLEVQNQVLNRLSRSGVDIPMISGGSGAEAMFFPDTAIVTIRRGKYAKPENYPHSQGHLNGSSNTISYYKGSWGDYSPQTGKGLCKFTGVDTTGLTCHEDERAEILAILESGIYL